MMIPIQAEYYALEGLGQLLETVELVKADLNPELAVSTILVTMYDARTRLAAGVADEVRGHFGDQVLRTAIPRSVRVSEAPSYGQTVMAYDPGSPGALSYLEAAREIATKGVTGMKATQRRGLGRGLGSLIPPAPEPVESAPRDRGAARGRAGAGRRLRLRRAAGRADRAQRRAAPPGVRRRGDGRAGAPRSARSGCCSRWSSDAPARTPTSW